MSWREFLLGLVDALAWPVAVLIIVWWFRDVLKALKARLAGDLADGGRVVIEASTTGVKLELGGAGTSVELSDEPEGDTTGVWVETGDQLLELDRLADEDD